MHVPPFARPLLAGAVAAALLVACSAPDDLGPDRDGILDYETVPVPFELAPQALSPIGDVAGEDGYRLATYGAGLGTRFTADVPKTLAVPGGSAAVRLHVSVFVKTGFLGDPAAGREYRVPDDVVVTAGSTTLRASDGDLVGVLPLDGTTLPAGGALGNVGVVYQGVVPHGADEVRVEVAGPGATGLKTPRAIVVQAVHEASTTVSSATAVPHYAYGIQGYEESLRVVSLPAGFAGGTITARVPIADIEDDSGDDAEGDAWHRYVDVEISAAGRTATRRVDLPTLGSELAIAELELDGLPAGPLDVEVRVVSPDCGPGQDCKRLGDSVWDGGVTIDWTVAERGGGEGCTPGFWKNWTGLKNQPDAWAATGYAHDQRFDDVFGVDAFGNRTLLEVARQGGGGLKALGRHAVAALLNAAHPSVSYDLAPGDVIAAFGATGSRGEVEALKDRFEDFNEQGCPLGRNDY